MSSELHTTPDSSKNVGVPFGKSQKKFHIFHTLIGNDAFSSSSRNSPWTDLRPFSLGGGGGGVAFDKNVLNGTNNVHIYI